MYFFKTLVEVVFYNRTNLLIIVELFLMCYFFFYLFQLLLNLISTHLQNAVSGAASAPRSPAIEWIFKEREKSDTERMHERRISSNKIKVMLSGSSSFTSTFQATMCLLKRKMILLL